jgi:5,6-dimethylbenzimidazole synthase
LRILAHPIFSIIFPEVNLGNASPGMNQPTLLPGISPAFDEVERDAVYRVIRARRDVRRGFLPTPLPSALLTRLLRAAHEAPSVGLMQPSRFIVIRSLEARLRVHKAFQEANEQAQAGYHGARRTQYSELKLEGILEAPQNLCILCDAESAQGHGLGRQTMPQMAEYSTVCAVQNLWLAARSEGVGVGWVSILSLDALRSILGIPAHIVPVAYLCLGYVDSFGSEPELERVGWERRASLESAIFEETYDAGRNQDRRAGGNPADE